MVLVTGATGFIGAQLVARFAGQGQEVLACDAGAPDRAGGDTRADRLKADERHHVANAERMAVDER